MERFSEIPSQQKAVLLVLLMLLMAGGLYFTVLSPQEQRISSFRAQYTQLSQEHEQLAQYKKRDMLEKLQQEEKDEAQRIAENRKMLPSKAELPQFIHSIKSDADSVSLTIHRFEVRKTEIKDYYARIPIDVRAIGTYPQLIAFFKTLAAPSKRIVNIKDIEVNDIPADDTMLRDLLGDTDELRALDEATDLAPDDVPSSEEHARYLKLLRYEALNSQAFIDAKFKVYAFSYTGRLAPLDGKKR